MPILAVRLTNHLYDPNKGGFISTISLEDSNTSFDFTDDCTKEKVGWIESNDGILVYDKNNGKRI